MPSHQKVTLLRLSIPHSEDLVKVTFSFERMPSHQKFALLRLSIPSFEDLVKVTLPLSKCPLINGHLVDAEHSLFRGPCCRVPLLAGGVLLLLMMCCEKVICSRPNKVVGSNRIWLLTVLWVTMQQE